MLVIWLLIRYRLFFPTAQTRTRWALVPAVLTVLALVVVPLDPSPTAAGWEAEAPPATSPRRAANAFGTPIPRGAGPVAFPGAQPLPEPRHQAPAAVRASVGTNVLPEYVGPIRGRLIEQWFFSRALGREMSYFMYFPPDYDESGRSYPVLYLLHGAAGDAAEWPVYGVIDMLDQAILAKDVEPFLVVLPQGEFGYWINHAEEGYRWGDYVTRDLVQHVDGTYRTLRRPHRRAIGGLSMGGAGALVQAFTHPQVFGIAGAHGPALREDNSLVPFLGTGTEFAARDPIALARTRPGIEQLQIMLDTGEEDPWYARVLVLYDVLLQRGIQHEFHVWPGGHDEAYWSSHTPEYLRFYSNALNHR
jgi:enterochelin esterase-like enzyme